MWNPLNKKNEKKEHKNKNIYEPSQTCMTHWKLELEPSLTHLYMLYLLLKLNNNFYILELKLSKYILFINIEDNWPNSNLKFKPTLDTWTVSWDKNIKGARVKQEGRVLPNWFSPMRSAATVSDPSCQTRLDSYH